MVRKDSKIEEVAEKPKVAEKSFVEEMETKRSIIASQNTEKANKDILIKTIKELEKHRDDAKKELSNITQEMETKLKALKHVDDEIKAQSFTMESQNQKFEKENADKIRIFEKNKADVEASDREYKTLLADVREKQRTLQVELGKISDERIVHTNEMVRLNKHVQDIEAEDSVLRHNIEEKEKELKLATEELEAAKESISPDLKNITDVKNENIILLQKLEAGQKSLDAQKESFESYKAKIAADAESDKAILKSRLEALSAEEGRLRQWEQDLNDIQLELKVESEEVSKQKKRYQLNEKLGENAK